MQGVETLAIIGNPGRRGRTKKGRFTKRHRNPAAVASMFGGHGRKKHRRRRAHRNPSSSHRRNAVAGLKPRPMDYLFGGAGVVGTEAISLAVAPMIPGNNPWVKIGAKAAAAVALGFVAGKFMGRRAGFAAGIGGGSVVAAELIGLLMSGGKSPAVGQFPGGYAEAYFPQRMGQFPRPLRMISQFPYQFHGSAVGQFPVNYDPTGPVRGF